MYVVHTCYFEFVHVYMHAFVHCTCMHEEIYGSLWHVDYAQCPASCGAKHSV